MARRPGLLGRQRRPPGVPRGDPADRVRRDRRGDRRAHRSLRCGRRRWRDGAAWILRADAIFASAQERIDPTTDFGKAMLNIMFVMAELQLDQLKSGWKTAKGRAIGRGAHIGPTPFGYLRVPRGQGRGLRDAYSRSGSRARCHEAVPPRRLRRGRERTGALYGRDLATQRRRALDNVLDRAPAREPRLPGGGRGPVRTTGRCETRARTSRLSMPRPGNPRSASAARTRCQELPRAVRSRPLRRVQVRDDRRAGRDERPAAGVSLPGPPRRRQVPGAFDGRGRAPRSLGHRTGGCPARRQRGPRRTGGGYTRARRRRSRRRSGARRVHARPREPRALRIAVRHLSRRPTPCTRGCRGGVPSCVDALGRPR